MQPIDLRSWQIKALQEDRLSAIVTCPRKRVATRQKFWVREVYWRERDIDDVTGEVLDYDGTITRYFEEIKNGGYQYINDFDNFHRYAHMAKRKSNSMTYEMSRYKLEITDVISDMFLREIPSEIIQSTGIQSHDLFEIQWDKDHRKYNWRFDPLIRVIRVRQI
jgi:hypothetical protein